MIGRIEGTGPIRTPSTVRRVAKSGGDSGDSFAKQLDDVSDAASLSGTSAAGNVSLVAGVFGLQEVEDATARASRGKKRASDILDELDDLRLALLTGELTKDQLLRLARLVNARRLEVSDPHLSQILDEIDLRAQVELAKYSHANTL